MRNILLAGPARTFPASNTVRRGFPQDSGLAILLPQVSALEFSGLIVLSLSVLRFEKRNE
jgi:hypothetical protein